MRFLIPFLKFPEPCRSPRTWKHSLDTVALEGTIRILCLERLLTLHGPKPPGIIDDTAKPIPCKGKRCSHTKNNNKNCYIFPFRESTPSFGNAPLPSSHSAPQELSPCPQGRTCPSLGITPSCLTPQIPTDQENLLLSLPLEQFLSFLLFFFFSRNCSKHQIKVSNNLYNITRVQPFIW